MSAPLLVADKLSFILNKKVKLAAAPRDAIRAAGAAPGGTATLHLSIDDTGHVTAANAGGMGFLPGAKACVEAAARALRVPNVDTGEATADVQLVFSPR